jgi:hypothetical protein
VNDPRALKLRPFALTPPVPPAGAPDYSVVARQNPFHPERNDAMPAPAESAQPLGPPPLVYGSLILGQERVALLATDSDPKPRRVAEGDMFAGYKLAKVMPQSVVLEAGGSSNEVMFYNALARIRRDMAKTPVTPPATAAAASGASGSAPATTTVSSAPPTTQAAAPKGKRRVESPFGPVWVDE